MSNAFHAASNSDFFGVALGLFAMKSFLNRFLAFAHLVISTKRDCSVSIAYFVVVESVCSMIGSSFSRGVCFGFELDCSGLCNVVTSEFSLLNISAPAIGTSESVE